MRSSLDAYTRYIEQQQAAEIDAAATADSTPLPAGFVLRNGMTIAVTGKPDAPTNQVVAEEQRSQSNAGAETSVLQRMPRHIQLLIQLADEQETEAAQKYYTRDFKESRRELIERLLDPTLTLEETARVLGVVPATVRRYTNRGVLQHHRTTGQQRRFRLSDVLTFLETQQTRGDDEEFLDS